MAGIYGNADANFGFTGDVPPGVSIEDNVKRLFEFRQTHSYDETFQWRKWGRTTVSI